jgi:hypothetical protein
MMATFNSKPSRATKWKFAAGILILAAGIMLADEEQTKISAAFAEKEFERAEIQFKSDKNNPTNAWQFARAIFDFAEFATNDTERGPETRRRALLSGDESRPACAHGIIRRTHSR